MGIQRAGIPQEQGTHLQGQCHKAILESWMCNTTGIAITSKNIETSEYGQEEKQRKSSGIFT